MSYLGILVVVDARKLELKVSLEPLARARLEVNDTTHARELARGLDSIEVALVGVLAQKDLVGRFDAPRVDNVGDLFVLLDGTFYGILFSKRYS